MLEGKKTQSVQDVLTDMHKHGISCGEEIARVAQRLHPNGRIFPLYRSVMVVTENEPQEGALTLRFYHDPHWLGEDEITEESLKHYYTGMMVIAGQRSGAEIFVPKDNKVDFEDAVEIPLSFERLKKIFIKDDDDDEAFLDGEFFVLSHRGRAIKEMLAPSSASDLDNDDRA